MKPWPIAAVSFIAGGALVGGVMKSAIQVTTAGAVCAVLDLLASGALPRSGFIRQEDIPLSAFLANRYGAVYAPEDQALRAAE